MSGGSGKTKQTAVGLKVPASAALTEAGRLMERYDAVRFGAVPQVTGPAAAKPTNARARMAREQAALGVRLAQQDRLTAAIERLTQATALDPTMATTWHDLGLTLMKAGQLEAAVRALGCAIYLQPGLISAHLNLGSAFELLGRDQEAQAAYEVLIGLDPTLHQVHARLAQIHLSNARVRRAEAAFRAAAGSAGADTTRARLYDAHAAVLGGRGEQAEALLRAIIADDPGCGEAHVALGQMLAEAGESGAAAESFARGIALDSDMAAAWYQFAAATKFDASHQEHVARMEACVVRPDLAPPQRQSIHFALAKAYDDLADYAASMRHLDAANRIRGAHRRLDQDLLARQTTAAIEATPPGFLLRRPDVGVDDPTPILIVGMPRSGTTLVEQILSSHPDVAAGGELSFWRERSRSGLRIYGDDATVEAPHRLAHDYLAVLRSISPDAARVTDKMPFNFAHLGVIRQVLPHATIIHCRRHPVDTCLSNFATNFQIQYDYAGDRGSLVGFYRQYQRLMAHWHDVLPSYRFMDVDYEALVADPETLTRRLIAICGLEWDDACLAPHKNRRSIGTASLWQARRPIYRTSVERWRRYEPWLGELRVLLPDAVDEPLAN